MRFIWLLGLLHFAMSAHAAPPPDASGRYHDWFRSLTVPGLSTACCTVADCRMVESRWNGRTQHYEAKVVRDAFSNALRNSPLYEKDPEAWIEIPDARIDQANNPTGRAVLCWSTFYPDFNGVFCFIPFQGA